LYTRKKASRVGVYLTNSADRLEGGDRKWGPQEGKNNFPKGRVFWTKNTYRKLTRKAPVRPKKIRISGNSRDHSKFLDPNQRGEWGSRYSRGKGKTEKTASDNEKNTF